MKAPSGSNGPASMSNPSSTTSTKADEFRRIEVITGVGRRRRWTDEEKIASGSGRRTGQAGEGSLLAAKIGARIVPAETPVQSTAMGASIPITAAVFSAFLKCPTKAY